jgi:hypothetical protein
MLIVRRGPDESLFTRRLVLNDRRRTSPKSNRLPSTSQEKQAL